MTIAFSIKTVSKYKSHKDKEAKVHKVVNRIW